MDSNFRWRTAHAAHDMDSGFHKLARDRRIDAAFILMSCIIYRHAFLKPSRFKCILRGRCVAVYLSPLRTDGCPKIIGERTCSRGQLSKGREKPSNNPGKAKVRSCQEGGRMTWQVLDLQFLGRRHSPTRCRGASRPELQLATALGFNCGCSATEAHQRRR